MRGCGKKLPLDTWMASTPASTSHLHTWTDSASVLPDGPMLKSASASSNSWALIFICRWKSWPTLARMARTTSRTNRARFSSGPPYSSLRSLIAELRNWVIRYPFAPCSSTPSSPASRARRAPSAKAADRLVDLLLGHRLAAEPVKRVGLARGRQAHRVLDAVDVALPPAVAQLHDELAVVLVHGLPHGAPERDVAVVVDHRVVGHDAAAQVHRHERRDDAPTPPLANLRSQLMRVWLPDPS